MMEMYGVTAWLTAEQEYQEVEGFVLARNQAILANWVRGESSGGSLPLARDGRWLPIRR